MADPIEVPEVVILWHPPGNYADAGSAGSPNGGSANATGGAAGVVSSPTAQQQGLDVAHDPVWHGGPQPSVDPLGAAHALAGLMQLAGGQFDHNPRDVLNLNNLFPHASLHVGWHDPINDTIDNQRQFLRPIPKHPVWDADNPELQFNSAHQIDIPAGALSPGLALFEGDFTAPTPMPRWLFDRTPAKFNPSTYVSSDLLDPQFYPDYLTPQQ